MDPHASVSRRASGGNAMRRKLAHAASSETPPVLPTCKRPRRDADPGTPSQNLLHRAC
jgi:hypothetical protein